MRLEFKEQIKKRVDAFVSYEESIDGFMKGAETGALE